MGTYSVSVLRGRAGSRSMSTHETVRLFHSEHSQMRGQVSKCPKAPIGDPIRRRSTGAIHCIAMLLIFPPVVLKQTAITVNI